MLFLIVLLLLLASAAITHPKRGRQGVMRAGPECFKGAPTEPL